MADYNQVPTGVPSRDISYAALASGSNTANATIFPFYTSATVTDFYNSGVTFLDKNASLINPSWRRKIKIVSR